ncbi:hypothetical protein [Paenibacillus sp. NPDC058174]|uniref:hypothetical protein n=1 Tax=Paenibacillus sp. NPDC058174 TaxID=3346366 RepID=UPI0036D94D96
MSNTKKNKERAITLNLLIDSLIGVGPIKFGMTKKEIRSVISSDVKEFKKTPTSETLTDVFDFCHVYYKQDDTCEAIELFEPAIPIFNNEKLIGVSFKEVKKLFLQLDKDVEIEETGLTSIKYGVALFVPSLSRSEKEPVEGVFLFEQGYYD